MTELTPGSPKWARVVTASKVAGILGLSPWDSPLTTWMKMRGELPSDDGRNAAAKSRGHYLESGVIAWWRDQHPGAVGTEQASFRLDDWGAATPDLAGDDDGHGNAYVMDAKTAASDDDWGDEPPAYYLAQTLWQFACKPEATVGYVAVLFGRPNLAFREYVIERDDELIDSVVARCREFYDSLTDDDARPGLSGMTCEYDAIRKAHPDIDRGERADIDADLAAEYLAANAASKNLKGLQARVLDQMGRAQYGVVGDIRIARRQPSGEAVALYCVAKPTDLTEGAAA